MNIIVKTYIIKQNVSGIGNFVQMDGKDESNRGGSDSIAKYKFARKRP